ncbi:hemoglobin [Bradyrhizobium sp. LB7.2]
MSNGRPAGTTERITKDMSDRLKAEREAAAERRNLLTQDAIKRTGITEEMIGELVTRFYGRVREDALLGPVFARVRNWDEHLANLRDFWSSVVLMSGRYHGSPMRAHMPLSLAGDHFDRWLDLSSNRPRTKSVRPRRPRCSSTRRAASPTALRWRRPPWRVGLPRRVTCSGPKDDRSACRRTATVFAFACATGRAVHQFRYHRAGLQNHHAMRAM